MTTKHYKQIWGVEKKHQKEIVMLSNAKYCKIMYVDAKLQRNTNSRQRSL